MDDYDSNDDGWFSVKAVIRISYIPATEPSGPDIKWSSSWIIRSGFVNPSLSNMDIASLSHESEANLSIVPISRVGGSLYIDSSITVIGKWSSSFEKEHSLLGQT